MRSIRDGAVGFVAAIIALLVQTYARADVIGASWKALIVGIIFWVAASLIDRRLASRSGSGKPKLRLDHELNLEDIDTYAWRFRLRIWNTGGGAVTPEVRVADCLVGDALNETPFSNRLPFLLPWSNPSSLPRLTRQHTAGETIAVAIVRSTRLKDGWMAIQYAKPTFFVPGAEDDARLVLTEEGIYFKVQAICPDRPDVKPAERWFTLQGFEHQGVNRDQFQMKSESYHRRPKPASQLNRLTTPPVP